MQLSEAQAHVYLAALKAKNEEILKLKSQVKGLRQELHQRTGNDSETPHAANAKLATDKETADCADWCFGQDSSLLLAAKIHANPAEPGDYTDALLCAMEAVLGTQPPTEDERSSPLCLFKWAQRVLHERTLSASHREWEMLAASASVANWSMSA